LNDCVHETSLLPGTQQAPELLDQSLMLHQRLANRNVGVANRPYDCRYPFAARIPLPRSDMEDVRAKFARAPGFAKWQTQVLD
jgi:hypothetical protein